MSEATIPLADSSALLSLFGTRDQHLRKIRDSLGVSVSGRNDRIHIEGPDEAVAKATEVFEKIKEDIKNCPALLALSWSFALLSSNWFGATRPEAKGSR
jgi:phosphate starvation-inducible PhoH-like protein